MRSALVALCALAACSPGGPSDSCVTNSDCESDNCVNGVCVALSDAGGRDAASVDAQVSDVPIPRDVRAVDVATTDVPAMDTSTCVPWTCRDLGQVCRDADDGCGGRLSCGTPGTTMHRDLEWGATQYVNWTFAGGPLEERVEHTLCFDEVPSVANGFGRGMFFQLYDGQIEGQGYYFGLQDRVGALPVPGPGAIFSKFGDRDVTHLRPGANSVIVNDDSEGGFISLRTPLPLSVGCYETLFERVEAADDGDWVRLTITYGGAAYEVGEIWFARTNPAQSIRFPNGSGTWFEFYGYQGRTSDEVPRWDVRVSIRGDGEAPNSMAVRYHRLAGDNASCEYLAATDEVRFLVGGDTFRCVPGMLNGDLYEETWVKR